jgi:dTDP-4-dehydrorhamnose reductase
MRVHERVLITGADGLLGRHLHAKLSEKCYVAARGRAALDITDAASIERTCEREQPALIVNCAVLGVDACTRDPDRACAINVVGPRNLAATASKSGADLVHFGSNYIFDGDRVAEMPYTSVDEARPLNQYGRSKLDGERAVRDRCARTFIVRSSWVFGRGKLGFVNETRRRVMAQERIDAVTDVRANATFVEDLVERTLEVIERGRYGTYHLVNTGVCSYYDIAVEIGQILGMSAAQRGRLIRRSTAADAPWITPRPPCTPLRCLLSEDLGLPPTRSWRIALADYLGRDWER